MSKDNPLSIISHTALTTNATFWQKVHILLLLEKAGYHMFTPTKIRFSKRILGYQPYANLVKGVVVYYGGDICCHQNTGDGKIFKSYNWWLEKLSRVRKVRVKWSENTFLDEQIKTLTK